MLIIVRTVASLLIDVCSENTPEGRRMTKLDQILLNGNNITMVKLIHQSYKVGDKSTPRVTVELYMYSQLNY